MENIQKIQDYLNGRLQGDDLAAFEKELATNTQLAEDFLMHKNLKMALMHTDWLDQFKTVKDIVAETPLQPDFEGYKTLVPRNKGGRGWRFWGLISIGILLIAALFLTYQRQVEKENLQAIAAPYWSEGFDYAVKIDEQDLSVFAEGLRQYKQGNYAACATALEKHLVGNDNDVVAQLYLGISYALSQQQTKAIETLKPLSERTSEMQSSAQWFLGLCYLREGDAENAQLLLNKLKNDVLYGEKATTILMDLNKK